MDLIDHDEAVLFVEAQLVLRVHQHQAPALGPATSLGEKSPRQGRGLVVEVRFDGSVFDQRLPRGEFVVLADGGLRGGGEQRLGKRFVLAQALGERVATVDALSPFVGGPDRRGARAREMGSVHEFDRQGPALPHQRHVGVRGFDQVVGCEIPGLLEPETGDLIQHLSLEGQGGHHDIEAAQPVGDDDKTPFAGNVVVSDLALLATAERREVGPYERPLALVSQESQIGAHESPLSRSD